MSQPIFRRPGHCPVCDQDTTFDAWGEWLRDQYLCANCGSIPRERALMYAIQNFAPNWRAMRLHESSPSPRGVSLVLKRECPRYTETQFVPSMAPGEMSSAGWRNEDLQNQTFVDASFDLVVTQDVFEHIFRPDKAIAEISRTLAPNGVHIASFPMTRQALFSERRATMNADGTVSHLFPPDYHQNPVDPEGSLVTFNWGFDVAAHFTRWAPDLATIIIARYDPGLGIEGYFNEVVVSVKSVPASV